MFCKKLCCDITIHLVTINFQNCIPYSVTPCIERFLCNELTIANNQYSSLYLLFLLLRSDESVSVELRPLMGPLSISQMFREWIWSNGGMILTGENWRTRRGTCPSATFPTNPTWTALGANPGLCGENPATNRVCCGTASVGLQPLTNPSFAHVYKLLTFGQWIWVENVWRQGLCRMCVWF
jgi:hypothetical protein